MKDFKSFLIGFLSCCCVFLFMGAGKSEDAEFRKLKVDVLRVGSILVFDDEKDTGYTIITGGNFDQQLITNRENIFDNSTPMISLSRNNGNDAMITMHDRYGDRGVAMIGQGSIYYKKEAFQHKFE